MCSDIYCEKKESILKIHKDCGVCSGDTSNFKIAANQDVIAKLGEKNTKITCTQN